MARGSSFWNYLFPSHAVENCAITAGTHVLTNHTINDARIPLIAHPPDETGCEPLCSDRHALTDSVLDQSRLHAHSSAASTSSPNLVSSNPLNDEHDDVEVGVPADIVFPLVTHPRHLESLGTMVERLVDSGMYDEYVRWRDGKARCRIGGAKDTRCEVVKRVALGSESLDNGYADDVCALFQDTFRSFMFKRTLVYWVAVCFIEGSLLFIIAFGFSCIQGTEDVFPTALTMWPCLIGDFWFLAGSYLGYVQQINWEFGPKTVGDSTWYFAAPWKLPVSFGTVGWQAYILGCVMFTVAQLMGLLSWSTLLQERLLFWGPMSVGGICFFVAGVCQVMENAEQCGSLVWWVSWANFFGGVLFLLGSILPMVNPHDKVLLLFGSNVPFLLGCMIYFASGVCSLFFWTKDMFGLTLSRKLNAVSTRHFRPLSSNTISSNVIYILASAVAWANLCLSLSGTQRQSVAVHVSEAINSCMLCVLVHLHFVLTSVVPILPKAQPYRALLLTIRFLSGFMVLDVVSTFVSLA